jgi:phosphoglycolate phosphatase-like HAD superfamily hydrolase
MLIIFDVDGTLIDNEIVDWAAFRAAMECVCGFLPASSFWDSVEERTTRAIIHAALASQPLEERNRLELLVEHEYLVRLQTAFQSQPEAFQATIGALELMDCLRATPGVMVAIATGDWHSPISFKLKTAGFNIAGIPMATSSDHHCRADIISLAASRAGRPLKDAVYVGDGLWDYRASSRLGIPFIGTGARINAFHQAGITHALPDLSPAPFQSVLRRIFVA